MLGGVAELREPCRACIIAIGRCNNMHLATGGRQSLPSPLILASGVDSKLGERNMIDSNLRPGCVKLRSKRDHGAEVPSESAWTVYMLNIVRL